jgi:Tfp pilus assembly protein PilV
MEAFLTRSHKAGFTLVESMIAAVIFTVAIIAIIFALNTGIFAVSDVENIKSALNLAQAKMEEVKGTTYASIVSQSKAVVPGFAAFKQQVAVTTVQTGLEQVVVTVYWTVKGSETNIALTTLVANG